MICSKCLQPMKQLFSSEYCDCNSLRKLTVCDSSMNYVMSSNGTCFPRQPYSHEQQSEQIERPFVFSKGDILVDRKFNKYEVLAVFSDNSADLKSRLTGDIYYNQKISSEFYSVKDRYLTKTETIIAPPQSKFKAGDTVGYDNSYYKFTVVLGNKNIFGRTRKECGFSEDAILDNQGYFHEIEQLKLINNKETK